ncbi:lytic murein transglycosylase, partial [Hydrogenophaga sp.]
MNLQTSLLLGAALLSSSVWAQTPTPTPNPEFDSCLNALRAPARAAGVRDDTFAQHTQNLAPDMSVIDKLNFQPEFRTAIWDYLAGL